VQPFGGSQVKAGHTATYTIFVWSTRAVSKDAVATVKVQPVAHVGAPKYTVCPSASGTTCRLGNLSVGLADELQATVKVGAKAAQGEHVELMARADATGSSPLQSSAAVQVAGGAAPSASPSSRAIGGGNGPATPRLPPPSTPPPALTLPPASGRTPRPPRCRLIRASSAVSWWASPSSLAP